MQDAGYTAIPLHRRDGTVRAYTLVDDADLPLVWELPWHLGSNGYARCNRGGLLLMHRMLMDAPAGLEVDHVNRDRLDNRRANLRIVTPAQNSHNTPARKGAASPFRGVLKDGNRWRARVKMNRRAYELGYYATDIEAALVLEAWRRENMPMATPDPALVEHLAR